MICCSNCFKDNEIKTIIKRLNVIGTCEVCGKSNAYTYDTEKNNELSDLFEGLLDIYTPVSSISNDFPKDELRVLENELYEVWEIFNIDGNKINRLVKSICPEKYARNPEIFLERIGIVESKQLDYLIEKSILKKYDWGEFTEAIKFNNRFHTNYINTDVLNMFCSYVVKKYKEGCSFYRARISNEAGYSIKEMGAPPQEKSTDGRANPRGISCLYLASDVKTTIHEVRAGAYDYITVGEFVLKKDIRVINFAQFPKISPFLDIDYTQHAINKQHLKRISSEIAKPLRRSDSSLDYLPTQYISDFIKSKGYDGIEYKSTLRTEGHNLAIFDEKLFECVKIDIYDVKKLDYTYTLIS